MSGFAVCNVGPAPKSEPTRVEFDWAQFSGLFPVEYDPHANISITEKAKKAGMRPEQIKLIANVEEALKSELAR